MEPKKHSRIYRVMDTVLGSVRSVYHVGKNLFHKTRKMPILYDEIDSLLQSQLITLDKDSTLLHSPDIRGLTDTLTKGVLEKLPNADQNTVKSVIENKATDAFLEMVTRGIDPGRKEREFTKLKKGKLFKKILIANRGEIALRILRACRELGIKAVVIYTKPDKDTLAVRFADQAICIAQDDTARSYLDIQKIIKIAKKTKCDAVHPGYGFLAENYEFAKLCEKKNIKFIGPSAKSLAVMSDKALARELMIKNNIPVVSGTKKALENAQQALEIAEKIGYPVILKAASGGGGKGMRIVEKKEELAGHFNSAKLEAQNSFGDDRLYIEKYIEDPRHIEFQLLADRYGNIIHLGERECTIQRRHQKLIEEAPSPALTPELREKMGAIAVKIAKLTTYEGAGTVEFLLDKNKNFYFMEMNKRIQVEHGVTEMITNVDLIKEQIKLAAGAELAYKQDDIKINTWAIECRINAESPYLDFEPSPGTVTEYLPPGGPGIRVCSSCHTGHKISPNYDSLIAKLMCTGKTRQEAIERMKRALGEYIIHGVETTIPFHLKVLSNKKFISGELNTNFIDDENILQELKKSKPRKSQLSEEQKQVIVSTAVVKYIERKNQFKTNNKAWSSAARFDAVYNNEGEMF